MAMKVDPGLTADLEWRGLIKQTTDPALGKVLAKEPLTAYCGFDPTADSLHVGNLLPLLALRRFQLAGHPVIAVVGGATGMIGDPSGKSQERSLLTPDQIHKNEQGVTNVIKRFLDTSGPAAAKVVNNKDWFAKLGYVDFLRDVGKHFSVNMMIGKESVRARLEDRDHGISYTEFSYLLLQSYDYYHLNQVHGCRLQIGGSDQWGNIVSGIELIRRISAAHGKEHAETFGLTHPLIEKSDGTKFGKTEKGAVWLTPERTTPYQFYQYFLQTADADVMNLIKYLTFISKDEAAALEKSLKAAPEKREAQKALAQALTELVHGKEELKKVQETTEGLFSGQKSLKELSADSIATMFSEAPTTSKPKSSLGGAGWALIDALVESGLCNSKGMARKDITGGGIYLNDERVSDAALNLTNKDLIAGKYLVLRKGKKNYHLVSFT